MRLGAKCVLVGWCVSIAGGTAIAGCYVCGETTCSIASGLNGACAAGSIATVCDKARRPADPGEPGSDGSDADDVMRTCRTYKSDDPAAWREDACSAREPDKKPEEGWDPLQADCVASMEEGQCCDINMDLVDVEIEEIGMTKTCDGEPCDGDVAGS